MIGQNKLKTKITAFLSLAETIPLVDVRSPSEFLAGHIPGAFNIPLFSDSERKAVGTLYSNSGRRVSVIEGLKLAGPSLYQKLQEAVNIASSDKLLVHCWRGGMRSEAMAWLFSLAGIETSVLEGGYKSYRRLVIDNLSSCRKMLVLGGLTGSGKTGIIKYLAETGNHAIDLEGLANHKGSAFGSLDRIPQPTSEHFGNLLFSAINKSHNGKPLWIEDESSNIGTVFLPEKFYLNMQESPTIVLLMDIETRLPRLLEEYSCYPADVLASSVERIRRRMGGDNASAAISAIRRGDFASAIRIVLRYYDKSYLHGLKSKHENRIIYVNSQTDNVEENASRILSAARNIVW